MARRRGGLIGGSGGYRDQLEQGKFDQFGGKTVVKRYKEAEKKRSQKSNKPSVSATPQMQVVNSNLKNLGFDASQLSNKSQNLIKKNNSPNVFNQIRNGERAFNPVSFRERRAEEERKRAESLASGFTKDQWEEAIDRNFGAGKGNRLSDLLAYREKSKYEFLDRAKDLDDETKSLELQRKSIRAEHALLGAYSYGVSQEEWDEYYRKNTFDIEVDGVKTKRLKANCDLPPMKYDANGRKLSAEEKEQLKEDYEEFSRFSTGSLAISNERDKAIKEKEKRKEYTANYDDRDEINSVSDAILHAINEPSKWKGPLAYGVTGKDNFEYNDFGAKLFKNLWEYNKKYVFRPFNEGDFKVLGFNALVNLGETLDLGARGAKGFLYGSQSIYGVNSGMSYSKDEGSQWVYGRSTGRSESARKDTQKRLIALGALDAIEGAGGARLNGGDAYSNTKSIEKRIKKEGLYDEYKRFKKEYLEYKSRINGPGTLGSFKDAYTKNYKEHYDVDTGNVFMDMGIEMLSDPTVVLGAAAGIGRSAIKNSTTAMANRTVRDVFAKVGLDNEPVIKDLTRQYGKRFGDSLMMKSHGNIEQDVKELFGRVERAVGTENKALVDTLKDEAIKSINEEVQSYKYRFIRSLDKLDTKVGQIDQMLLKSVFAAPYVSYKAVKLPYRLIERSVEDATAIDKLTVAELRKGLADPVTKELNIYSYEKLDKTAADEAVKGALDAEIINNTKAVISKIDDVFVAARRSNSDQVYNDLDKVVSEAMGGKCTTYSEFMEFIDNLPVAGDEMFAVRDQLRMQRDTIDDYYKKIQYKNNIDLLNVLKDGLVEERINTSDFFRNVEVNFNKISDPELKRDLVALEDSLGVIDDEFERIVKLKDGLRNLIDNYESKNIFISDKATGKVDKVEGLLDNKTKIPLYKDNKMGEDLRQLFTMLLAGNFVNSNAVKFKELFKKLGIDRINYRNGMTKSGFVEDLIKSDGREVFRKFKKDDAFVDVAKDHYAEGLLDEVAANVNVESGKLSDRIMHKFFGRNKRALDMSDLEKAELERSVAPLTAEENRIINERIVEDTVFEKYSSGEKYKVEKTKSFKDWVSEEGTPLKTFVDYKNNVLEEDVHQIIRESAGADELVDSAVKDVVGDFSDFKRSYDRSILQDYFTKSELRKLGITEDSVLNIDRGLIDWVFTGVNERNANIIKNTIQTPNSEYYRMFKTIRNDERLNYLKTNPDVPYFRRYYKDKDKKSRVRVLNNDFVSLFYSPEDLKVIIDDLHAKYPKLSKDDIEVLFQARMRLLYKVYHDSKGFYEKRLGRAYKKAYDSYQEGLKKTNYAGYTEYIDRQKVQYLLKYESPFEDSLRNKGLTYADRSLRERKMREYYLHQIYVQRKKEYYATLNKRVKEAYFNEYIPQRKQAFVKDYGDLREIRMVEMVEPLQDLVMNLNRKERLSRTLEVLDSGLNAGTKNELRSEVIGFTDFEHSLRDVANELLDLIEAEQNMKIRVDAESQIVELQEDKFHYYTRVAQNDVVDEILNNTATSNTLLGKYYTSFKTKDAPLLMDEDKYYDGGVATRDEVQYISDLENPGVHAEDKFNVFTKNVFGALSSIITASEGYVAGRRLVNRLINNRTGMSEQKVMALMESLMGSQKRAAHDFYDSTGVAMTDLIQNSEVHLAARYGGDKLALDSFRKQITDFDGELWQDFCRRFKVDSEDVKLRNRIVNLCSGGHIDPSNDIKVTVLQAIARDADFIDTMNGYALVQPVVFVDIETQGLNFKQHHITGLSMFNWDHLENSNDLSSVLDFIEDTSKVEKYQTYLSEEEIKTRIDKRVLMSLYENDPRIDSYEDALKDYLSKYSVEANGGVEVSEYEVLSKFVNALDNAAIKYNERVPKVATFNTRGYDLDFLFARLQDPEYLLFPQHISDLSALRKEEFNVYKRLLQRQGDFVYTADQCQEIAEAISDYACRLPDGARMTMLDMSNMIRDYRLALDNLYVLRKMKESGEIDHALGADAAYRLKQEMPELPIDAKNSYAMLFDDELYNELIKTVNRLDEEFKQLQKGSIEKVYKRELLCGNQFEGYTQNSLMKRLNDGVDEGIYRIGYNKPYNPDEFGRIFDIVDADLSQNTFKDTCELVRNVMKDANQRMKRNSYVIDPDVMEKSEFVIRAAIDLGNNVPDVHALAYWKYLKVPDNAMERYALAKILYDRMVNIKRNAVPLEIDEGSKGVSVGFVKSYNSMLYYERKATEEYNYFSNSQIKLLNDKDALFYYSDENVLFDIYRDAPKPIPRKYDEANDIGAKEFLKTAKSVSSEIMKIDAIEQGAMADSLTNSHKVRLRAMRGILSQLSEFCTKMGVLEDTVDEGTAIAFRKAIIHAGNKAYAVRKDLQDMQILRYINQSEDNLCSHLLFHGNFLVCPERGTAEHILEYNKLIDLLKTCDRSKVVYKITESGDLFIGTNKRWTNKLQIEKDGRTIREDAVIYYGNESKGYKAPLYYGYGFDEEQFAKDVKEYLFDLDEIEDEGFKEAVEQFIDSGADGNDLIKAAAEYIQGYERHLHYLTGGMSDGSVGFLFDRNTVRKSFANFPADFLSQVIDEEYACADRWMHVPAMQMCFLGDADNCWHVGSVDIEETDLIFGTLGTLRRLTSRASTEACVLDFMFNKDDACNINKLFSKEDGWSDEKIVEVLKDNESVTVAYLSDANNDLGYAVKYLDINNSRDVEFARKVNAIVVDYHSFADSAEVINRNTSNSELFKWWARLATIQKQVVLIRPMTWVRNALDAYVKGSLDTHAPLSLGANVIHAQKMISQYKRINRIIEQERGLHHNTEQHLKANFEHITRGEENPMSWDTYQQLDSWMSAGRSGGQSRQSLEIEKLLQQDKAWKDRNKSKVTGRDVVANDIERFKGFSVEEAGRNYDRLSADERSVLSKEDFLGIHSGAKIDATDVQIKQYDMLVDSIIKNYRGGGFSWDGAKRMAARTYDYISNKALFGMSYAEEHLRLAQYLTLADLGYSDSAIHRHIVDSQFDTTIKSQGQKVLETIVPFYSFAKSNIVFWAKMIQQDPLSIRMLEHVFSQLSWNFDSMEPYDYYSLRDMLSGNINTDLLPENPFFDVSGWFKLNPSMMDAFSWAWGPGEKLGEMLYPPIKAGLGFAAYESGSDLFNIFGGDFSENWTKRTLVDMLPVVSVIKGYTVNPKSLYSTGVHFSRERFEESGFKRYCKNLEKEGLYYNVKTGKAEPLSTRPGTDLDKNGLSYEYCSWFERTQRGRLFDNNLRAWVPISQYTIGGLNRDWDFSKEGQWEEFVKEHERRFNEKWDNNQRKFVDPHDYIYGMLNEDNLSWDQYVKYHEKMFPDEKWDANQSNWVPKDEYIEGGLNRDDLSWNEVCALKYYIRGEEWDYDQHKWVKTHEPEVDIESYLYHTIKADNDDASKHADASKHNRDYLDALKIYAYAGERDDVDVLDGMRTSIKLLRTYNPSALTGNPANDEMVINSILAKANEFDKTRSYPYKSFDRTYDYKSGRAGDVTFRRKSFVPNKQQFVQLYGNRGVQSGGKRYSDPFSFANDNSGLKMATSKYAAYDSYYSYEYQKLYHMNGTKDFLAHYPQTNETMQRYGNRFNNTYKASSYYRGAYTASSFKGFGRTIRHNLKQQMKLSQYQH